MPGARPWRLPRRLPLTEVSARRLAVVGALFCLVFGVRLALRDVSDPVGELYVVPVAAAALSFGRRGGLAAVALAMGLIVAWHQWLGGQIGWSGYVLRALVLTACGGLVGQYADRLTETRRRWDGVLDGSPDAVLLVDDGGRILSANATVSALFGYPPAALVGRPVGVLVPDEAQGRHGGHVDRYFRRPLLRPMGVGLDLSARRADGGTFPVEVSLAPVIQDRDVAVLVTVRDVTDRQRAERELRESEHRFRGSLETMLDPFVILAAVRDDDGRIVDFAYDYVNSAAAEENGVPPDRHAGRRLLEVRPEHRTSGLFDSYARVVRTGRPLLLHEFPYEAPSGRRRYFDLRASRLGDGLAVTWRDATDRVHAAAEQRQAHQQFRAAFGRAPVGMALVGFDGRIRQANDALGAMLGRHPSRLAGRPLAQFTDPRDADVDAVGMAALLAGGTTNVRSDQRLRDADGNALWASVSASRVPDETGLPGYLIVHVEDISERKGYESRLRHLADHDPLTGLLNRRRFSEELDRQLGLEARYGGRGAVVLLDLDNFKYVNDTLGHAVGDELLCTVAAALRGRARETDLLARLGGDEFAVLAPAAAEEHARGLAAALVDAVRTHGVVRTGGVRVRTTASAGVVVLATERESVEGVLAHADLAMYAAKEAGRDRYVVYDPAGPHLAVSQARFRWIDRIQEALRDDLFELHAQPILELASGKVTQYELLLRLREGGELVLPDRFLYVAERHGLAGPIDRWVVEEAVRLAAAYPLPGTRLEVNLSGESLGDPELPELIESALDRHGVHPARLVFEVTERTAIANMDAARAFVERISRLGCGFALDDFGAGFGSFYYLKHLPLDYLKIDGEFVHELPASHTDQLIVRSVVEAAHGLGKRTIAEYVGSDATLDLLREYGVDFAQGFHVGQPAHPADALGMSPA